MQKEKHLKALNSFAERIKKDSNVIALLLYGSLAYGTVGEKSDIGVMLIVRDGSIPKDRIVAAEEDDIHIRLDICEVAKFKKGLQEVRGGYGHGILGGGHMVFSKDEALLALHEETRKIGEDDAPKAFADKISMLYNWMWKAEKYITVIDDPLYAQRFLQLGAAIVAEMELIRHRENPNREAIRRARELNPQLMHEAYTIPSTTTMTAADIRYTLHVLDGYLMEHMEWWSKHIIRFLSDGEPKPWRLISKQCVGAAALWYLEDKGVVMKTTLPMRIFKSSKFTIDETAYVYIKEDHENGQQ